MTSSTMPQHKRPPRTTCGGGGGGGGGGGRGRGRGGMPPRPPLPPVVEAGAHPYANAPPVPPPRPRGVPPLPPHGPGGNANPGQRQNGTARTEIREVIDLIHDATAQETTANDLRRDELNATRERDAVVAANAAEERRQMVLDRESARQLALQAAQNQAATTAAMTGMMTQMAQFMQNMQNQQNQQHNNGA